MDNISGIFEELAKWQSNLQTTDFSATKDKSTILLVVISLCLILISASTWSNAVFVRFNLHTNIQPNVPYSYITGSTYLDHLFEPFRLFGRVKEAAVKSYQKVFIAPLHLTEFNISFPTPFSGFLFIITPGAW